ncbi:MAG: aminopeptidase P family protein [Desulfobacteraceae bacterium]|nr:aminopeptidase P family protein [Desulfobacteraceae bacterium]
MSELIYTPKQEIENRINSLQLEINKAQLDGVIIVHHTNLFYFSGTSQSAHLFVPKEGKPLLVVRKSFKRAEQESSIDNIVEEKSIKKLGETIVNAGFKDLSKIGFELDVMPVNTFRFYDDKIFTGSEIIDASNIFKKIRLIKSKWEIDLLRISCKALTQGFASVPELIKQGMTEIELAGLFEAQLRKQGYGGCSKMRAFNQDFLFGNIVSGKSGSVPSYFDGPVGGEGVTPANNPHGAGWKKIERNEPVYIDYTCVVNGYTADGERIFVMGDLSDKFYQAHENALKIQDALISMIEPGVEWQALYLKAIEMADEFSMLENFMGIGNDRVKFVGHGVGLELDEFPVFAKGLSMKLKKGMTFALEPKFVFPDGAVGIENTFVLRDSRVEKLTLFDENIIKL